MQLPSKGLSGVSSPGTYKQDSGLRAVAGSAWTHHLSAGGLGCFLQIQHLWFQDVSDVPQLRTLPNDPIFCPFRLLSSTGRPSARSDVGLPALDAAAHMKTPMRPFSKGQQEWAISASRKRTCTPGKAIANDLTPVGCELVPSLQRSTIAVCSGSCSDTSPPVSPASPSLLVSWLFTLLDAARFADR